MMFGITPPHITVVVQGEPTKEKVITAIAADQYREFPIAGVKEFSADLQQVYDRSTWRRNDDGSTHIAIPIAPTTFDMVKEE